MCRCADVCRCIFYGPVIFTVRMHGLEKSAIHRVQAHCTDGLTYEALRTCFNRHYLLIVA